MAILQSFNFFIECKLFGDNCQNSFLPYSLVPLAVELLVSNWILELSEFHKIGSLIRAMVINRKIWRSRRQLYVADKSPEDWFSCRHKMSPVEFFFSHRSFSSCLYLKGRNIAINKCMLVNAIAIKLTSDAAWACIFWNKMLKSLGTENCNLWSWKIVCLFYIKRIIILHECTSKYSTLKLSTNLLATTVKEVSSLALLFGSHGLRSSESD